MKFIDQINCKLPISGIKDNVSFGIWNFEIMEIAYKGNIGGSSLLGILGLNLTV